MSHSLKFSTWQETWQRYVQASQNAHWRPRLVYRPILPFQRFIAKDTYRWLGEEGILLPPPPKIPNFVEETAGSTPLGVTKPFADARTSRNTNTAACCPVMVVIKVAKQDRRIYCIIGRLGKWFLLLLSAEKSGTSNSRETKEEVEAGVLDLLCIPNALNVLCLAMPNTYETKVLHEWSFLNRRNCVRLLISKIPRLRTTKISDHDAFILMKIETWLSDTDMQLFLLLRLELASTAPASRFCHSLCMSYCIALQNDPFRVFRAATGSVLILVLYLAIAAG